MAARAGRRRKVCGAAPQAGGLPKLHSLPAGLPGPDELHVDGLDLEGPDQRAVAWYTWPP